MHKWSGLLSGVKALRLCSHVRMSGQAFHCRHKSCLRGLSLRLGRNRTPALRDDWKAVWSCRWRTWSLFSSPVAGDKSPPASPVCHCQQDWRGSGSMEHYNSWMCNTWLQVWTYGRDVRGLYRPVVISFLTSEQSAVTWGVGVLNLLKVCAPAHSDMTDDSTR